MQYSHRENKEMRAKPNDTVLVVNAVQTQSNRSNERTRPEVLKKHQVEKTPVVYFYVHNSLAVRHLLGSLKITFPISFSLSAVNTSSIRITFLFYFIRLSIVLFRFSMIRVTVARRTKN